MPFERETSWPVHYKFIFFRNWKWTKRFLNMNIGDTNLKYRARNLLGWLRERTLTPKTGTMWNDTLTLLNGPTKCWVHRASGWVDNNRQLCWIVLDTLVANNTTISHHIVGNRILLNKETSLNRDHFIPLFIIANPKTTDCVYYVNIQWGERACTPFARIAVHRGGSQKGSDYLTVRLYNFDYNFGFRRWLNEPKGTQRKGTDESMFPFCLIDRLSL